MKNLKMKAKIAASFAVVLAMLIVLASLSMILISDINNDGQKIAAHSVPSTVAVHQIRRSVEAIKGYALEAMVVVNQQELDNVVENLKAARATLDSAVKDYIALNPEDQGIIDTMNKSLDDVSTYREIIINHCAKFTTVGKQSAYLIYQNNYTPAFDRVVDCAMQLNDEVNAGVTDSYNAMASSYKIAIFVMIIVAIAALVSTVVLTIVLSNAVTRPMDEIKNAMRYVSAGDFENANISYKSKDELGDLADNIRDTVSNLEVLINDMAYVCGEMGNGNFTVSSQHDEVYVGKYQQMLTSLNFIRSTLSNTLTSIDQSASQVLAGSQQVSDGAQNLSQGATEQASAIEELAATIADLAEKVQQNARNAANANEMSTEAGANVAESNEHMQQLMAAMNEINNTAADIGKIIKTIEDIAFQTNILALNAAVEAARAGEAGKGFAVVADEVRNLAGKSAEAANNTTTLIENAISAIKAGTNLANSTAVSLQSVVEKTAGVNAKVQEISTASEQQATAISQIGTGIDQISAVVQTNSATAEQSAAASEELSGQADLLKSLINQFVLESKDNDFFSPAAPAVSGFKEPEAAAEYSPFSADFDTVDDKY